MKALVLGFVSRYLVFAVLSLWAVESIRAVEIVHLGSLSAWLPFLGGFLGYLGLWTSLLRRNRTFSFWETTDHELMHALGAVVSLRGVRRMSSSASAGGAVEVERPNALVALMPYLLSGPLIIVVLLAAIASSRFESAADVLLGLALAYHLVRVARTTHPRQTDLRYLSFPLSLALILAAMVVVVFLVAGHASAFPGGVGGYLARTWTLAAQDLTTFF